MEAPSPAAAAEQGGEGGRPRPGGVSAAPSFTTRLRQAVLAASELDAVAGELRDRLGLGEPYSDPGVALFGLRNAVFAVGDQFLEVVSPVKPGTAAGRWLERRGSDGGYMLMFQVEDLDSIRRRAHENGVREVWAIGLDDIEEAHLHPTDMSGAIVSVSRPSPPGAWRWGGPEWNRRSVDGRVTGVTVAVIDPERTAARWSDVLGTDCRELGVRFTGDQGNRGLVEIETTVAGSDGVEIGGVRFAAPAAERMGA